MSFETIEENRRDWGQEMVLLEILIGLRVQIKQYFHGGVFSHLWGLWYKRKETEVGGFRKSLGAAHADGGTPGAVDVRSPV